MRLTTWNVNGIRNPFSYQPWNTARTFPAMFDILGSDIVVMQELKIQRKDLRDDMVMLDGWDCYFSLPKHKKGYSGVGMYTRNATCAPIRAEEGLLGVLPSPSGVPYCELPEGQSIGGYPSAFRIAELGLDPAALDAEGRCLVLEFPAFVLIGVYSPANSNGLRDDFRYGFLCMLDCRIRNLIRAGKRVVLVGDLNVSRDELDGASAKDDMRKAGITHDEYISTPNRRIFNQLLIDGEVFGERDEGREAAVLWDTTRGFHAERRGMYTHWEQKVNARPGNFGSRIDFVLVCEAMRGWVKGADTQEGLLGSDHCPVYADFSDEVEIEGSTIPLIDILHPAGMYEYGQRKKEWKLQDAPAFSGKRLPEFDKRRSIKSTFTAPNLKASASTGVTKTPVISENTTHPPQTEKGSEPAYELSATVENAVSNTPNPKRSPPGGLIQEKAGKRQKPNTPLPAGKSQQSLRGFFQKPKPIDEAIAASSTTAGSGSTSTLPAMTPSTPGTVTQDAPAGSASDADVSSQQPDASRATTMPESPAASTEDITDYSPSRFTARVAAAEQTQKSWGTLFSRPVAPRCEAHNEPCKTMLTKKKGPNQGRSFWMCVRPLGPSGGKETGTQWRCPTFIWCSDWQSKKEEGKTGDPG